MMIQIKGELVLLFMLPLCWSPRRAQALSEEDEGQYVYGHLPYRASGVLTGRRLPASWDDYRDAFAAAGLIPNSRFANQRPVESEYFPAQDSSNYWQKTAPSTQWEEALKLARAGWLRGNPRPEEYEYDYEYDNKNWAPTYGEDQEDFYQQDGMPLENEERRKSDDLFDDLLLRYLLGQPQEQVSSNQDPVLLRRRTMGNSEGANNDIPPKEQFSNKKPQEKVVSTSEKTIEHTTSTESSSTTTQPPTTTSPRRVDRGQKEFPLLRPASENRRQFSLWALSLEDQLSKAKSDNAVLKNKSSKDQDRPVDDLLTDELSHLKQKKH